MANIAGQFAIFKLGVKNQMAYKADYVASLLFRIVRPLILLTVWAVIFLNTGAPTIGGLTLTETAAYFFLVMPVTVMIGEDVTDTMQNDVQAGAVASARVKPMSYPLNVLFRSLAVGAVDIAVLVVPLLLITIFAFHLTLTPVALLLFVAEALIGLAIVNLFGFFIGTMTIRITNVYGLSSVFYNLTWLVSGAMMPLNFFPSYVQGLLALTPFPVMCYLPVATLLGGVSVQQAVTGIAYSFAWAVALTALAYVWWKRVSKGMGSVGG